MEKKFDKECICSNLQDAGCDKRIEKEFMKLEEKREYCKQIELLRRQRAKLLEKMHICQNKLECLDYLIYRLEQRKKECNGKKNER